MVEKKGWKVVGRHKTAPRTAAAERKHTLLNLLLSVHRKWTYEREQGPFFGPEAAPVASDVVSPRANSAPPEKLPSLHDDRTRLGYYKIFVIK